MKKLLIYTLLLAHLCTGLVFASDAHSEAFVTHDASGVVLSVVSHAGHGHDEVQRDGAYSSDEIHYEDHHCHGSAHLVGLICSQMMPLVPNRNFSFWVRSQAPVSIYTPPLLRPPIV
ncbi:MAG: hypothetical protein L3J38_06135 [Thiomicrorhabdus sp.]|nr:hypothetical protein [Thiomicrorhabdus sp.]MCF6346443.1 hypothetical protein [Thiomicrorhabdus sp.]